MDPQFVYNHQKKLDHLQYQFVQLHVALVSLEVIHVPVYFFLTKGKKIIIKITFKSIKLPSIYYLNIFLNNTKKKSLKLLSYNTKACFAKIHLTGYV